MHVWFRWYFSLTVMFHNRLEHIELFSYICPCIKLQNTMFFFGAFSGNLLYLILAISSLAGCSAMVFRSIESPLKVIKTADTRLSQVLLTNQLSEISVSYYTQVIDPVNQILNEEVAFRPPLIPFFVAIYIPPLIPDKSHFSGSPLFSRPPPFYLG